MESKAVRDDPGAQQTIRETQDRQVPDDIMRQLHEANGHADGLRQQLDAALGEAQFGTAGRAEAVGEALRAAEREIEEINGRIREASPPEAKGG